MTAEKYFEAVSEFKCLGMKLTHQINIHKFGKLFVWKQDAQENIWTLDLFFEA
jgi:hypothetical protein